MNKNNKKHNEAKGSCTSGQVSIQEGKQMKSKAYVAFLNKAITYERDIEILDVLSHKEFSNIDIDNTRHPKIANLEITEHETKIRTSHLKSTLYEGLIKNAYEIMMWYFRDIINSVLKHGVDPVKVSDTNLKAMTIAEIIKAGSWNALCDEISNRIVRGLENLRDTPSAIQELGKRLAVDVDTKCLEDAKPYFEIRHLFVHNNGNPDEKFKREHSNFVVNGEIKLQCKNVKAALHKIRTFVGKFDKAIIAKKILSPEDCQP